MEEDIKVLEEFIEKNIKSSLRTELNANELRAIENLIKKYKELEEKNKKIKNIDYYNLVEEFEMGLYMPRCNVEEYYIPIENLDDYIEKSKVREKIEERYGTLCMELGSYVRDEATPEQERIAGGMNELRKLKNELLQEGDDK